MPARDPDKPKGYYCDAARHRKDCPDKASCPGCLSPCAARAGHGTNHVGWGRCNRHGGSTRNHVIAAEVKMAEAAASKLDLTITTDPVSALLDELNRRFRWVAFLESLVMALPTHPEEDEFVPPEGERKGYYVRGAPGLYGRIYAVSGLPTGEAKPHILVEMYERERQQLVRVAGECVKANVSQRVMDLAETQAKQVADVLSDFAKRLGLDPTAPEVREAGGSALRLISGGSADTG